MSNDVQPGQSISARLWNALAAMVRRGQPLQGAGIILKQTPAGTIIEAAGSAAREFLLGRVFSVNGDEQSAPGHVVPSAIVYGIKIPSRPDLGTVTFATEAIIRAAHDDLFQVWPMALNTPVCVMIAKTDDAAKPEKLWLVAIEAPFSELCSVNP